MSELKNNFVFPGEPLVAEFCLLQGTQAQLTNARFVVEAIYPDGVPPGRRVTLLSALSLYGANWHNEVNEPKTELHIKFHTHSPLASSEQIWRRLPDVTDEQGTLALFGRMPETAIEFAGRTRAPQPTFAFET